MSKIVDGIKYSDDMKKIERVSKDTKNAVFVESVTEIGQNAFRGCTALSEIKFTGTLSQWNAVEKGEMWNKNAPAKTVHCSDGDAEI